MRSRLTLLLVLLLFLLPACELFSRPVTPLPPVIATGVAGTLTALAPTSSPLPSASPQVGTATIQPTPQPTLTPTPNQGFPPPATPITLPVGEKTFILLGSDQRPNAPDFRTDIMVVVVLSPDGSVRLISFPRDLWVYLPGRFMQRINTAQEYGGFSLLQSTFQYNFGFTPQSYILTDFEGFKSIVDTLGGVDVVVGQTYHDAREGYFPQGFTVKAGLVHMDGDTALWYSRSRESTGDLDRLRRSQEVLVAIGRKLLSLNGLTRIPQLYQALRGAVVTDLTLQNALDLLPTLQGIDPNRIQRYEIGIDQIIPYVMPASGADVLLPRPAAIRQVLLQALGGD
jgi:LCP family protein required for cell wall assembly